MPAPHLSQTAPAQSQGQSQMTTQYTDDYAAKADKYLSHYKTPITGAMLAAAAKQTFEKYGKTVPVELALAQAQTESNLGVVGKDKTTNNPFSIGNTDDSATVAFPSIQEGINKYFDFMAKGYLSKRTPDQLLQNFVNHNGERYAAEPNYEDTLKTVLKKVYQYER